MSNPAHTLAERFLNKHPEEAASLLDARTPERIAVLLLELPADLAAKTLTHLSAACSVDTLNHMPAADAARVLLDTPPPWTATLVARLPDDVRGRILDELPRDRASAVRAQLAPRDSIGAHMDPTALAFRETLTVAQAQSTLRRSSSRVHDRLFVVDAQERLLGALEPIVLLSSAPDALLSSCGMRQVTRLQRNHPLPLASRQEAWKRWTAMPVVDRQDRFVGSLHRDTVKRLERKQLQPLTSQPLSMVYSFAELLWLGFAAMTGGIHKQTPPKPAAPRRREDTP